MRRQKQGWGKEKKKAPAYMAGWRRASGGEDKRLPREKRGAERKDKRRQERREGDVKHAG
jgi:hypothetical protein